MNHHIRTEFIKRILQEEGGEIDRDQVAAINKYLHFRSGRLRDDRSKEVTNSGDFGGRITFTHPIRQRFLDIKPKKPFKTSRRRKGFPIHNRIIFGRLNSIAYKLMYGLTDEVADRIKKDVDNLKI